MAARAEVMAFEQEAMQKAVCASAVLPFSAISPKAAVKGSIPSLTTDRARVGTAPAAHLFLDEIRIDRYVFSHGLLLSVVLHRKNAIPVPLSRSGNGGPEREEKGWIMR